MKKQFNKIALLVVVALLVLAVSSCKDPAKQTVGSDQSGSGYPITAADDTGRKIVIKKQIKRIVSLSPGNTEILFVLRLADKVVGVDDFSNYPKAAKNKEKVGGFSTPNIEKIISLKPDLVLADASLQAKEVTELKRLKIIVFSTDSKNLEDIVGLIDKVGRITASGDQAEKVTGRITAEIEEVRSKTRDLRKDEKPVVFYELYNEPLMSAGPSTFIGDMISIAGGKNIAGASKEDYPQFSLETLVDKDPKVYLAGSGSMTDPGDLKNRPGWENLTAVKEGNVFVLDEDIINRPGPRVAQGLALVARAIHPELFKD